MTALFGRRRISVSVAWRLIVGLLPTILAVALVVGLFYYGQAGREAPRVLLLPAALLTVLSLLITWANVRYFANRIARLGRMARANEDLGGRVDEFDRIEEAVGSLGTALSTAANERVRAETVANDQRRDEATTLAAVVADALAQLDGVRLPLHILLEAPFGELNDNQEELLRDARGAADAIDTALRRLGQVADADRGALIAQLQLVQVNDVVRSVLPIARSAAMRRGARMNAALEPALPRITVDRIRLAEALALLATDAARETGVTVPLAISTAHEPRGTVIRLHPAPSGAGTDVPSAAWILATRLVAVQRGELVVHDGGCEVFFPGAGVEPARTGMAR
ncbi:MAG: hypothetical protein ACRENQ_09445 [Gemmatimonadaceae bacterium]